VPKLVTEHSDCVEEERTVDMYAPLDKPAHPAFIAELKRHDPGFVLVKAMALTKQGDRRARDGWQFCRITYMRRD
jgi:hypothetical protein